MLNLERNPDHFCLPTETHILKSFKYVSKIIGCELEAFFEEVENPGYVKQSQR